MTDVREHPPPAIASAASAAPAKAVTRPGRVVGLDGIRGLAALFVVLNHIFERAWPGYPAGHAPFWAAWMTYGRFAVVMFIALSGFSLGRGPSLPDPARTRPPDPRRATAEAADPGELALGRCHRDRLGAHQRPAASPLTSIRPSL